MRKARQLLLLLIVALLLAGTAVSPTSVRGKTNNTTTSLVSPILGPFFDIQTDNKINIISAIVYNSVHDEYLAIWITYQDDYTNDVWGGRVAPDGTIISKFCIASKAGYRLVGADAAYSPTQDRYFVVIQHNVVENDYDLFAVSLKYDGTDITGWHVVDNDLFIQSKPSVAYNSQDDEYLVVYNYYHADMTVEIAGRRFRASDDAPLKPDRVTIAYGFGEGRADPDVAYNPIRNNYLVAYNYFGGTTPTYKVTAKIANNTLSVFVREFELDDMAAWTLSVAAGQDEFLAFWSSLDAYKLYARRVNYNGSLPGESFPVSSLSNVPGTYAEASASRHGYWLMWTDNFPNSSLLAVGFVPLGADKALLSNFPIDISLAVSAKIACSWQGRCLIANVYIPEGKTAFEADIHGRFIDPYGIFLPFIIR